jgi:hypothetical protein
MSTKHHVRDQRERDPDADRGEARREQGVIGQITRIHHDKRYGYLRAGDIEYFFNADDFLRPGAFDEVLAGEQVTFEPRDRSPMGSRHWYPMGSRATRIELA